MLLMRKKLLRQISKRMQERYSNRYRSLRYDVRTLGWGSTEQQELRFDQTLHGGVDFTNRVVLDLGCGFGDYLSFLSNRKMRFREYIGMDINPDLLNEARKRHSRRRRQNFRFTTGDLVIETPKKPIADVGVMLGVLNLNHKGVVDNYEYSFLCIRNAFALVREALIVDFLSANRFTEYPKEEFVFYHEPERMLSFALTLTPGVLLKHDYEPIPQKEFMMFLKKTDL